MVQVHDIGRSLLNLWGYFGPKGNEFLLSGVLFCDHINDIRVVNRIIALLVRLRINEGNSHDVSGAFPRLKV